MYQINKITFQKWSDAEREQRDYLRRFGFNLRIFTDCPKHEWGEAYEGYCLKCMVEVYEEHLEVSDD